MVIVQSLAKQILELFELRKNIEEHVDEQMKEEAPNISAILGTAVGARILAHAGSLKRLANGCLQAQFKFWEQKRRCFVR